MKNLLLHLLLCASFGLQADGNNIPLPIMPANDFCSGAIPITPSEAGANCTIAGFTLPFSTDGTTDYSLACTSSEFSWRVDVWLQTD